MSRSELTPHPYVLVDTWLCRQIWPSLTRFLVRIQASVASLPHVSPPMRLSCGLGEMHYEARSLRRLISRRTLSPRNQSGPS